MRKYGRALLSGYFLRFKTSGDGAVAEAYIYDGWESVSEPTSKSTFSGSVQYYTDKHTITRRAQCPHSSLGGGTRACPRVQAVEHLAGERWTDLAQRLLASFWERNKDLKDKVKPGIEAITFGPDVPPHIRAAVETIIRKHRRVFESAADGCPLTLHVRALTMHGA